MATAMRFMKDEGRQLGYVRTQYLTINFVWKHAKTATFTFGLTHKYRL